MIDKLELLVREDVPRRTENWGKYPVRPAKVGLVYAHTLDADFQLALRIHFNLRSPGPKENRHVKVDFTDTRLLSAEDLLSRLTWMFRIQREQALSLRVSRIDFAADVYGVPVDWFRRHSHVKRKRRAQAYEVSLTESSKGVVTSVVFGRRPDLYRIYDWVAEKRGRGIEVLHDGMLTGAPIPIVTRVERQCSGRTIPKALATLGDLFENVAAADPFPALLCTATDDRQASMKDWPPQKLLMSVGLATLVEEFGEATVRARLNQKGNGKRIFSKYSDLLRSDSPGVTVHRLREIYRKGTIRQLNIPVRGAEGEIHYPAGAFMLTL